MEAAELGTFIAGKTGNFPPTVILILGGLMLTYGVW